MKKHSFYIKIFSFIVALLFPAIGSYAQTLIISEVADPGDVYQARFVELYNASSSTIDLAAGNYYLTRQTNAATSYGDVALTGTIASGETYVIAMDSSAFATNYAGVTPDQYSGDISGNGDDAYILYIGGDHTTGTLVDIYGVLGEDGTGKPWEYKDGRAERVASVGSANTTWTASEWNVASANVADMTPGTHTCDFGGSISAEPTNHVTAFAANADNASSITLTWSDNDGAQPADGFLILASSAKTAPVDSVAQADDTDLTDGSGVINVAHGVQTYTFDNCSASTTYNFEIYPYTNSGVNIDYKTDGTIPTTSATTAAPAPAIVNIAYSPSNVMSTDEVFVSADITDADGTVSSAKVAWGTTSGALNDTIVMNVTTAPTYKTATAITAQADSTVVYFQVIAIDNDGNTTSSEENSYMVVDPLTSTLPYVETFDTGLGKMVGYSVVGDQSWYQNSYNGSTYAKMSGYSGGAKENVDWLITPTFDFTGLTNIKFQYDEAFNYASDIDAEQEVYISTDYVGVGSPDSATWTKLTITGRPATSGYVFGTVAPVDLTAYAGQSNVHIGFKYTSTTSAAATWEVDSIVVEEAVALQSPVVNNVVVSPVTPTSTDEISVSADVTDADGTISSVKLIWGTATGVLNDTIVMNVATAPTYTVSSVIPAQANGTTVYYKVEAIDNDANNTTTDEMSVSVKDPIIADLPFIHGFENGFDSLVVYSVVGDQAWDTTSYGVPAPCAKMSGYSGSSLDNEDWMITPGLNFADVTTAKLNFDEAINYTGDVETQQGVYISTDYAGTGDPSSATWTKLNVTGRSTGSSWSFVSVDDCDLSAYAGQAKVYIAFKYISTTSASGTWEVDNIKISTEEAVQAPVIANVVTAPEAPTSSDAVSISADITDANGTISSAKLYWGTDTFYGNTIDMVAGTGDTFTTSTDIPAQANGTVIFFKIEATDNDGNTTTTDDLNFGVQDPFNGDLPFVEYFMHGLGDMSAYSVVGDQEWGASSYNGSNYAKMNGYAGSANPNEDWLITPKLNLVGASNVTLTFDEAIKYSASIENEQEVYISTDYAGTGDPSSATWTKLNITGRTSGESWTFVTTNPFDLSDYLADSTVYIGFKYTSTDTAAGTWELDNISVSSANGIIFNASQAISVYPNPAVNSITVSGVSVGAKVEITSIDGKVVYSNNLSGNKIDISNLNIGVYFVKVSSDNNTHIMRFIKK